MKEAILFAILALNFAAINETWLKVTVINCLCNDDVKLSMRSFE